MNRSSHFTEVLNVAFAVAFAVLATCDDMHAQALFSKVAFGPLVTGSGDSRACAIGDIDNDGDTDVFVANMGTTSVLYTNQGENVFTPTVSAAASDVGPASDAVFADIDNDNDLDLLVTRRFSGNHGLYRNQGGAQGGVLGHFVTDSTDAFAIANGDATGIAVGDIDGDNDIDIVVAQSSGDTNAVFINQGGAQLGVVGAFEARSNGMFIDDLAYSSGVDLGDIDGDNDLDLAIANRAGDDNTLYLNDGAGNFTPSPTGSGPEGDTVACAFVDLDGDDDLDLIFVNFLELNQVYRNRGNLQGGIEGVMDLVVGHALSLGAGQHSFGLAVGDWNNDDLNDVVILNCCGQNNALYESSGFFNFMQVASGPAVFDGGYSHDACFFDSDNDGDEELFVTNSLFGISDKNALYRNDLILSGAGFIDLGEALGGAAGEPALSGTGTLVPGSSVSFLLNDAAPLSFASIVVGTGQLSLPFKGGTLVPSLDYALPFPTDVAGSFRLDGIWPFGLPSGAKSYYQAWVVDPTAPHGLAASNALEGTAY